MKNLKSVLIFSLTWDIGENIKRKVKQNQAKSRREKLCYEFRIICVNVIIKNILINLFINLQNGFIYFTIFLVVIFSQIYYIIFSF